MATGYLAENSCFSQAKQPTGFSIVVDDADGNHFVDVDERMFGDKRGRQSQPTSTAANPVSASASCSCTSVNQPDESIDKIRQIQDEMESRKNEFAKLLEEYAQVVLQVKQMEEREAALTNA